MQRMPLVALATVLVAGCGPSTPPEGTEIGAPDSAQTVQYSIGSDARIRTLYPDQSWLPEPYRSSYPDYASTIEHFTAQSLQRDGIEYSDLEAELIGAEWSISFTSDDPRAGDFGTVQATFLDADHAVHAANGIALCQSTSGCWDNHAPSDAPWAFFLPLGMAMVNQQGLMFMDYPPNSSLSPQKDYLDNFTVDRWSRILGAVGIQQPQLYESIVDSRPIAAAGTGQQQYLPDAETYFNAAGTDRYYLTPMFELLADPPSNQSATNTVAVAVFGDPARAAWGSMVDNGGPVGVLQVGAARLGGATKLTPWIGTNHPDVTTYECCPNDPSTQHCYDEEYGWSYDLIPDEQIDLQAACFIQAMGADPSRDPQTVKSECQAAWGVELSKLPPVNAHTLCVQAKLDNNDPAARCDSVAAAEAYCDAFDDDPCHDFTCTVPTS